MKKIKIYCLLAFCILLSGCSAEYTLEIDENLNFTESFIIVESPDYFKDIKQTVDEYVKFNSQFYENDPIYSKFNYQVAEKNNEVILSAKRGSMKIDDFNNNSIVYGTLFSSINASEKDGQLTINTTDYQGKNFFTEPYSLGDPSYEKANFTIRTPLKLISSNADIIDEKNGVYTWNFARNGKERNIEIKLSTSIDLTTRILILLKKYWFIPIILLVMVTGIIKIAAMRAKNNEI